MNLPENIKKALGYVETPISTGSSPLAKLVAQAGSSIGFGRCVPNVQPKLPAPYKVAVIGEAPGAEEDQNGVPFCGASGRFLSALLIASKMARDTCFIGNICNHRPPDNDFNALFTDSKTFSRHSLLQSSLERLEADLTLFNPNVCILLGRIPLYFATGEWRSIGDWRGSVFLGTQGPFAGRKCIATYHPAGVLRMYDWAPLLRFDLARARTQGLSSDYYSLRRNLRTGLSFDEIISALESVTRAYDSAERDGKGYPDLWVSFDLEGYWNRVTRFSFALSPTEGFIVPITRGEYDSFWTAEQESAIWCAVARVLGDARIPKTLQNSLYDRFVLAYQHRILISNVAADTMLAHWELYAELKKELGLQASIYTSEPHWKENREHDDLHEREIYCCKDSAVTEEIRLAQEPHLRANPAIWNHYQFNLRLLNPLLYMELRGLKYDANAAAEARVKVLAELWLKKHELNSIAGKTFVGTRTALLAICISRIVKVRERMHCLSFVQLPSLCLKKYSEAAQAIADLDREGLITDSQLATNNALLGELEYWLNIELNVGSSPQMIEWFYVTRKFERQYERKGERTALSTDVFAMLNLYRKTNDPAPKLVLQIRSLLYLSNTLDTQCDPDQRIRCGYNVVATETGRLACYQSPTGSGYNLQTVTKKLRYLFVADDGYWMCQLDLAGADGWTVAAHCASLGDATMLDDYNFGLKPARIIALMYMDLESDLSGYRTLHGSFAPDSFLRESLARISLHFNSLSRAELKSLCKQVDSDGWLYFGSKRVQHGTNYGAQPAIVSDIILKDSYKFLGEPIYMPPRTTGLLQRLYLNRYPGIPRWHARVGSVLLQHERLVAASGRVRRFFGRIRDGREVNHETLKAALSNEPQDNTTYATNLGVYNLWHDPDNRDSSRRTGLIVEPLHQVHDAMITQFPKDLTEWAIGKHREWMDNELMIAGRKIKIPYEANYGRSWGELTEGTF